MGKMVFVKCPCGAVIDRYSIPESSRKTIRRTTTCRECKKKVLYEVSSMHSSSQYV